MVILTEIFNIAVYSVLGIILMLAGNFLIDLIIPCHFPTEIKKGNQAVGWLSAGSFIGMAVILKAAIMSPVVESIEETLASGVINSILYFAIGVVFFILGYFIVDFWNRKYRLSEEIGNGNVAAGIMVFGIFVALGIIISGVVM